MTMKPDFDMIAGNIIDASVAARLHEVFPLKDEISNTLKNIWNQAVDACAESAEYSGNDYGKVWVDKPSILKNKI